MKIAWIEDDADIISPLVYPLEKEGFEVLKFPSIAEAKNSLKKIAESDLILLDTIVPAGPGQDATSRYPGLELLREWRYANVALPPVIALTVVSNPEVLDALKALLVAKIIRKPALPSELQKRVHEVLRME